MAMGNPMEDLKLTLTRLRDQLTVTSGLKSNRMPDLGATSPWVSLMSMIGTYLVGGPQPVLKMMESIGMMTATQYEWENAKHGNQTTNQLWNPLTHVAFKEKHVNINL